LANTDSASLPFVQTFLTDARNSYLRTRDRDVVPDFVSSHTYPNRAANPTLADVLGQIDQWGTVYDQLRAIIDQTWAGVNDAGGRPLGPQIKLADSEYNFTVDASDPRASDVGFLDRYQRAMLAMLHDHGVWLGIEFTIASHDGGAQDLLSSDGSPKPLYDAFRAASRRR
jgi:hypothetical protein